MNLVPEWAPNLHPLVIHFPIALLTLAVAADVAGLFWRKNKRFHPFCLILYVVGALSAIVAYLTGESALETLVPSGAAESAITRHSDMAEWTVWFFGIYTVIRVILHRTGAVRNMAVRLPTVLVGVAGFALLFMTAERGARLVFEHGLGVRAADIETQQSAPSPAAAVTSIEADSAGWRLYPAHPTAWKSRMTWLAGDPDDVSGSITAVDSASVALEIDPGGSLFMAAYDLSLSDVEVDLRFNTDEFDGAFAVVHNVQDALNYFFVKVDGDTLTLGRIVEGAVEAMDNTIKPLGGWQRLRVVADGTHYRAYDREGLVVHGHTDAAPGGLVGLLVEGSGPLKITGLRARKLR